MNEQAEKFLKDFTMLESWLRQQTSSDNYVTFTNLVDIGSGMNNVIRAHRDYLKSLGNLRNAIVHGRSFPITILATPELSVIKEFGIICDEIYQPKTVYEIAAKQIVPLSLEKHLHEALIAMRTHDYSQVIVQLTNGDYGIITREGITKWIEANLAEDIVSLQDVTLEDVFAHEDVNAWDYISRKKSVYDAATIFGQTDRRIQALLVSENGRKNDKPLGVITFWDISQYFGSKPYPIL